MEYAKITAELAHDVRLVKGSRSHRAFRIWTTDHEAEFVIQRGSVSSGNFGKISELKKGQRIELTISNDHLDHLKTQSTEVYIYGLSVNGSSLLSPKEFEANMLKYLLRKKCLFFLVGMMSIINGIVSIPRKLNYLFVGLIFILVLTMKIVGFGLY